MRSKINCDCALINCIVISLTVSLVKGAMSLTKLTAQCHLWTHVKICDCRALVLSRKHDYSSIDILYMCFKTNTILVIFGCSVRNDVRP